MWGIWWASLFKKQLGQRRRNAWLILLMRAGNILTEKWLVKKKTIILADLLTLHPNLNPKVPQAPHTLASFWCLCSKRSELDDFLLIWVQTVSIILQRGTSEGVLEGGSRICLVMSIIVKTILSLFAERHWIARRECWNFAIYPYWDFLHFCNEAEYGYHSCILIMSYSRFWKEAL